MAKDMSLKGSTKTSHRLLKLPNEILQEIACILSTDRDILSFSLTCREIWERVFSPNSGIWHRRFQNQYDAPHGHSPGELKMEYQIRAIVLPQRIDSKKAHNGQKNLWMRVIQGMLVEFLTLPPSPGGVSKTYEKICNAPAMKSFLKAPAKEGSHSQVFCALQVCLTALALDPSISGQGCLRTDYDIGIVYSFYNRPDGRPLFGHKRLSLTTLLHMRNFWQHHLLSPHEITFHESFSLLPQDLMPKAPNANATDEVILGTSWLGYWSCIHPIPTMVEDLERRQSCADLLSHMDQVDPMTMEIDPCPAQPFWPSPFNDIIPQVGGPQAKRSYFKGKQKTFGGDADEHPNSVVGFIEPMDVPHGGFSGWTRICFVIYEQVTDDGYIEEENLLWIHGYEAVVIPGGNVMLGRWVDLRETSARGPVIFWGV
ncbi:hypothetical protein NUU61_009704 [Penicillium alfredii]|uniref:F-box domain-containing protein n=1 Tax=Penicillium alfredii TaxID=1506179 RepID=A0A9W9EGQ9_9EURO|nr:uncharacterized protein NUU61_009704 [Penicillium alfredii]KAJ5081440.1 hypothetical protein NUU61_009704 [Penicillium alfredii]